MPEKIVDSLPDLTEIKRNCDEPPDLSIVALELPPNFLGFLDSSQFAVERKNILAVAKKNAFFRINARANMSQVWSPPVGRFTVKVDQSACAD